MTERRFLSFARNALDTRSKVIFRFSSKPDWCLENGNFCATFIPYNLGRNRKELIPSVTNFPDNVVRLFIFLTEITTTSTSTVTATTEKTKLHTSPSASQFVKTEKMRFSSMEMVIIGFSFGFVAGAVIAWLVVITARVCSKSRKKLEILMTSSEYNGYIQSGV